VFANISTQVSDAGEQIQEPISSQTKQNIKAALKRNHDGGFIHGGIRIPKFLIRSNGDVIDFETLLPLSSDRLLFHTNWPRTIVILPEHKD
jgi:hypothetical protein